MIRNSYGEGLWTFPGGGVYRKETLQQAVRREVDEEVGLNVRKMVFICKYTTDKYYKHDTMYGFYSKVEHPYLTLESPEIKEARWFPLNKLPESQEPEAKQLMDMYNKKYQS